MLWGLLVVLSLKLEEKCLFHIVAPQLGPPRLIAMPSSLPEGELVPTWTRRVAWQQDLQEWWSKWAISSPSTCRALKEPEWAICSLCLGLKTSLCSCSLLLLALTTAHLTLFKQVEYCIKWFHKCHFSSEDFFFSSFSFFFPVLSLSPCSWCLCLFNPSFHTSLSLYSFFRIAAEQSSRLAKYRSLR